MSSHGLCERTARPEGQIRLAGHLAWGSLNMLFVTQKDPFSALDMVLYGLVGRQCSPPLGCIFFQNKHTQLTHHVLQCHQILSYPISLWTCFTPMVLPLFYFIEILSFLSFYNDSSLSCCPYNLFTNIQYL